MLFQAFITSILLIIFINSNFVNCLFEVCDHRLALAAGGSIYINSPSYPNRYPSGSSCRYTVTAPSNEQINVQCSLEFDTYQQQCSTEIFYFNQQGSTSIPGSEFFCGNGQLSKKSVANVAVLSYVSSGQYSAGRFTCLATATSTTSGGGGSSCECGWSVTRRIVGGSEAGINEFPSMAGVYDKSVMRIFCGATIIHSSYLMSAAHCYLQQNYVGNLAVIVGDHDFTITTDTPYTRTYDIQRLIIHEQFASDTKQNDIALLQTTIPMTWSNGIGPACLPFNYNSPSFTGSQVDVPGWGTLSYGGTQPHQLRKVTLDIVRNPQCSLQVPNLFASQICTYTFGKDTCQYDSGGGAFFRQNRMFVVGITSYGFGCASTLPSISTRVSSYLSWIQARTGVDYCRK